MFTFQTMVKRLVRIKTNALKCQGKQNCKFIWDLCLSSSLVDTFASKWRLKMLTSYNDKKKKEERRKVWGREREREKEMVKILFYFSLFKNFEKCHFVLQSNSYDQLVSWLSSVDQQNVFMLIQISVKNLIIKSYAIGHIF